MFLMYADPLRGQVGVGWKSRVFLGPVKWHRADRRVPFYKAVDRNPCTPQLYFSGQELGVGHLTHNPHEQQYRVQVCYLVAKGKQITKVVGKE
jgi:hypothetical protein